MKNRSWGICFLLLGIVVSVIFYPIFSLISFLLILGLVLLDP